MANKKCPICGTDNSEMAKFCSACGASVNEAVAPAEPTVQTVSEPQYQAPPQGNPYQAPPQGNPYQAPPQGNPYQAPPQGNPYQAPPQSNPYQAPPQSNPYQAPPQNNPYQAPPQGNPYQPYQPYQVPFGYQQKSKIAAGILGIFLGCFGVHNFYLGYTSKAIAQLLLGTVGWITCGIAPTAAAVWGLIEGIMILTGSIKLDGKNVPLSE